MTEDIIKDITVPSSSRDYIIRKPTKEDIKLNAEYIVNDYHIKTIVGNKSMWIYNQKKGLYLSNAETEIQKACARSSAYNTRHSYNELLFNIQGLSFTDMKDFETIPGFINLKNGVYSVDKDAIIEFSPKYNFKYCLNFEYDRFASCDLFEKMVINMTGTIEDYNLIQKWFGCHFIINNLKKALFIVGPTNTSKSTLLWVLQQLIGEDYCAAYSLGDLTSSNKYYVADLYNKLANINADTSAMKIKDTSTFKLLTGGDLISAREIRKRPFQFRNKAKFTFAFNYLPFADDIILSDLAFLERIMIIIVKKGYDQKDDYIQDKLYKEFPGIFNWAMKGFRNFLKEGFNYNKNYEETKDAWIKYMTISKRKISENELLKLPMIR